MEYEDRVHVSTPAPWLLWIKDSVVIMSLEKKEGHQTYVNCWGRISPVAAAVSQFLPFWLGGVPAETNQSSLSGSQHFCAYLSLRHNVSLKLKRGHGRFDS